ncbi:hypothetical protein OROGR_027187 [Orobanche gracilis]
MESRSAHDLWVIFLYFRIYKLSMDGPIYSSEDDYEEYHDEEINNDSEELDQAGGDEEEDGGNEEEDREDLEEDGGDQNEEIGNAATSRKKKVRGLTRLVKMHNEFKDSKGKKRALEFDKWGRLIGKYRAEFSSFLGDLVRRDVGLRVLKWKAATKQLKDKLWDSIKLYYEIDDSRRKQIMCHLAEHLRDYRRKLYVKYIEPNIGKPRKLKVVPKQYEGIVKQEDWKTFVEWRLSPEFKDVSKAAKQARAKAKYPHRLGRLGYSGLREKLEFSRMKPVKRGQVVKVKNKELVENEDDIPVRSVMWRKARQTKEGEYKDDDVRNVVNEIIFHENELAEGSTKPEEGTDALTLVFGKDHSGRVRGVGRGVTPTKYWNIPRRKGSSNDRIVELEKQLAIERQQRESAVEEVKHLCAKIKLEDEKSKQLATTVKEQGLKFDALYSYFASQGMKLPSFPTTNNKCQRQESLRSDLPSSPHMQTKQSAQLAGTSIRSSHSVQEPSNAIRSSHFNSPESENMASQVVPTKDPACQLAYPSLRNIVARGRVYYSSEKQTIHGVALKDDCCRVSIDESVKPASFLPIQAGDHKTVGDAIHSFVAWPKSLVIPDNTEEPISSEPANHQNPKKRRKNYITVNELQKQKLTRSNFNKKRSNILDN